MVLWIALAGCGDAEDVYPAPMPDAPAPGASLTPDSSPGPSPPGVGALPDALPTSAAPGGTAPRMVFMGTSLTEGLGLDRPEVEAWPARIGELASSAGIPLRIVNAGLSGETSAGSLRRIDWVLRQPAEILVLETGANDGLRALPVDDLEANLSSIIQRVRVGAPGTRIALVAMEAPPNMGETYAEAFRDVFPRVAGQWNAALIPFPLDGVAGIPSLNQGDGIHPTAEGHWIMARNAWPVLEALLSSLGAPTPP